MKRILCMLLVLIAVLLLPACSTAPGGPEAGKTYTQITQEEAKKRMALNDGHIILDVRSREEYNEGHIPGAVLLPNEEIGGERPEILPDPDQILLIYCRSGRRSKEAAQKLFDLGYTNVYEFGGILTWDGEIVTGEGDEGKPAVLSFSSFAGGPEFTVSVQDESIVSVEQRSDFGDKRYDTIDGASCEVIITFTGLRPGETTANVSAHAPAAENYEIIYAVTVDEEKNVTLEQTDFIVLDAEVRPLPELVIEANGTRFYADFEDNPSAEAFCEWLSREGPITVEMHDYGDFEKVGDLPQEFPRSDASITTKPGDVILYQGKQITIYYDENTWNFTKLARIEGKTREALLEVFGEGDLAVTFWVEWGE